MKPESNEVMGRPPDYWILTITLVLCAVGTLMIFSASCVTTSLSPGYNYDPFYFLKKQALWVAAGLLAMWGAMRVNLLTVKRYSFLFVLLAIGALAAVLLPQIGTEVGGARRWISFGFMSFQPAEMAKLALIIYLADCLARRGNRIKELKRLTPALIIFGAIVLLIEKEPDLGTAIVISASFVALLFIAGAKTGHLFTFCSLGIALMGFRIFTEPYRMKRILAFLNPWADPMGSGYHLIQSLLALGSGGTWGLGLGQSRQKFFYLPERFTDSIFAIIGEELGLVTTLAITVLFLCFLYRGFKIARAAKHPFLSLLASGITFSIVFQAFLNIGVITGALPCTGIPLPFISFGGSSLVFSMIGVGFLINISSCDPKAQEKARRSSGSIYLGNEVLDMANSGMGETGSGIRENRGAREAKG